MSKQNNLAHVRPLTPKEALGHLESVDTPASNLLRAALSNSLCLFRKSAINLASYSYGDAIAQWLGRIQPIPKYYVPCGRQEKLCAGCQNLSAEFANGPPLLLLLKNSVEVFVDAPVLGPDTEQALTVPICLLSPGSIVGPASNLTDFSTKQITSDIIRPTAMPLFKVRAGARSLFLSTPLRDCDFQGRVLSLPGVRTIAHQMDSASLDFDGDSWQLVRLLAYAADFSDQFRTHWRADVLIIPAGVLTSLFESNPTFKYGLLEIALAQSQSSCSSILATKRLIEIASCSTVEAQAHRNEIVRIIINQRLGYGPAQDESLGPFLTLLSFIAATGITKTRTLTGRIPAILTPKNFNITGKKPDFTYYSLSRPTAQLPIYPPNRSSKTMEAIAHATGRLRNSKAIPEFGVIFFASEKQPKSLIPIHPIKHNAWLTADFGEQLELAESKFGLRRETALGNPRSGFLGHFVRIANNSDWKRLCKEKPLTEERFAML